LFCLAPAADGTFSAVRSYVDLRKHAMTDRSHSIHTPRTCAHPSQQHPATSHLNSCTTCASFFLSLHSCSHIMSSHCY
jgi:2-polyprenyl-6-methoxyphenol hydroxylase-like FAD-dependent oxidoreductase